MQDILASFALAVRLIAGGDPELWRIVVLSLEVSLASAFLACTIGLPLGAWFGLHLNGRAPGLWIGLILGLSVAALGLALRVAARLRRGAVHPAG